MSLKLVIGFKRRIAKLVYTFHKDNDTHQHSCNIMDSAHNKPHASQYFPSLSEFDELLSPNSPQRVNLKKYFTVGKHFAVIQFQVLPL